MATGLKTFSYLYRFLENGYITTETVLIIEEPEVHLHPKWVVEYARILVHLHKQVGVKILLASHDPDMVAALQSIGEKEELGEKLNFYIAKRNEENKHQFDFISTETNIVFMLSSLIRSFYPVSFVPFIRWVRQIVCLHHLDNMAPPTSPNSG